MDSTNDKRKYWLDDPRNVNKVFWGLVTVCALLVVFDFFYHKHTYYDVESVIGYHGWYGFVSCWCLVIAAKQLRKLVKRDEDYYD
jgi:hypothetical protein